MSEKQCEFCLDYTSECVCKAGTSVRALRLSLKEKESQLASLRAEHLGMEAALENQIERWNMIPSGIDEEADPYNKSPDDATAHIGGLAVQEIKQALSSSTSIAEAVREVRELCENVSENIHASLCDRELPCSGLHMKIRAALNKLKEIA